MFEPIPPGAEKGFLDSLGDQLFIPNVDQLNEFDRLSWLRFLSTRFSLFAEKFVLAVGNYILEQLEEIILQIIDLVVNWEKHLADALEALADFLEDLEREITRLNSQLIALFGVAETGLREFFDVFSGSTLKSRIKAALKDVFVDKAIGVLEDNDIYKNLPREFRRGVRSNLKSVIDGLMNNPIVDPVLDAVKKVADNLSDLLLDCRELDPEENLPEQVMLLVLDKIEDNIREHFGGTKPHLNIGFDFGFRDFFGNHHSVHISLGKIEVNLNLFLDAVRDTIQGLDFYHDLLNSACFKLGKALAKELEIAAAELRKKEKQEEKRRLEKIAAEHDNGPREIAVLNPVALSHHSKAIDVRIHLGGVPLSFLGLEKDEIQRVLIYLNGELVPVKSLLVEGSTKIKNPKDHLADFNLGNSKALDARTGILKNGIASIITDTSRLFPTHSVNKQKRSEGARYAFSFSEYQEQPVAKTLYAVAGKKNGTAPILSLNIKVDGKGHRVSEYEIENNMPGRGNASSRINEFLEDRMAGILLQFRVELDELIEGVNVLTVVVVEKGGNRHQQNVSFTVTKAKIKKPVGTLPGLPTGVGVITLKPADASAKKKQPRKSVSLVLKQNGRSGLKTKKVNTLLPIDSKSLGKKKLEALKYLQDQDKLNFARK